MSHGSPKHLAIPNLPKPTKTLPLGFPNFNPNSQYRRSNLGLAKLANRVQDLTNHPHQERDTVDQRLAWFYH
jgi:hypothetical protein